MEAQSPPLRPLPSCTLATPNWALNSDDAVAVTPGQSAALERSSETSRSSVTSLDAVTPLPSAAVAVIRTVPLRSLTVSRPRLEIVALSGSLTVQNASFNEVSAGVKVAP